MFEHLEKKSPIKDGMHDDFGDYLTAAREEMEEHETDS